MSRWRHPGLLGAVVYGTAAALLGAIVTVVARLQVAGVRGRTAMVRRLPEGPLIVIANHTSYADGVLLLLVCRRLGRSARLLATAGVFKVPLLGRVLRRMGFIPVARGSERAADALDPAAEALANGEVVALFPEGRVTRDVERWPERAKTGAVRLALRTGVPIVPVALDGAHRVVGRKGVVRSLIKNIVLRPRVRTAVGAPIDARSLLRGEPTPEEVRRISDEVMSQLVDLVEHLRGESAPAAAGVDRAPD